jgi:hypothetical protein
MHDGEVYRLFSIRKDGVVVLDGNPQNEFPPTQTSLKTLYMNDDEVCEMKLDRLHAFFRDRYCSRRARAARCATAPKG